jgi:hypothetical protein
MDIVILRPLRDPRVREALVKGGDLGEAWKERAMEVLKKAYDEGKHVDLTYPVVGTGAVDERGKGEVVCEIFRCEGFEWIPEVRTADGRERRYS